VNELHPDDAMKTTPQTAILSFRTWLRQPPGTMHCPYAIEDAVLWIKTGHLPS
jgi:hypothetical protein